MKSAVLVLLCLAEVALRGAVAPVFRVELTKAGDGVFLHSAAGADVVAITSESGIGGAKLVRTGASWPSHIIIQLRLRGLESFWMQNGTHHFETFLRGSRRVPYSKMDRSGNPSRERAGALDVVITQKEGTIEVRVPGEMFAGNPASISLGWIDFYRR